MKILTKILEEEPTFLESGIVNNVKMHRISKILSEIIKFLPPEEQYQIEEDLSVTQYFNNQFKQSIANEEIAMGGRESPKLPKITISPRLRDKSQRASLSVPLIRTYAHYHNIALTHTLSPSLYYSLAH
jgi:hypothetical protein